MRAVPIVAVMLLAGATAAAGPKQKKDKPRQKPWLGVSIDPQASWGGVAVIDVFADTPAALCGLRAGDEIIAIDGVEVHGTTELQNTVGAREVGDKVKVSYVRGGDLRKCKAKLAVQVTDPTELVQRKLVDRPMPAFSLATHADGTVVDSASTRDQVVVLGLFSTACDDCATQLSDLASRFAADDAAAQVAFYAVSGDGAEAVDAYIQRMGLGVPIALDQADLVRRYLQEARTAVTIIVIDHDGKVEFAASGAGPDETHLDSAVFCASRAEHARRKDAE